MTRADQIAAQAELFLRRVEKLDCSAEEFVAGLDRALELLGAARLEGLRALVEPAEEDAGLACPAELQTATGSYDPAGLGAGLGKDRAPVCAGCGAGREEHARVEPAGLPLRSNQLRRAPDGGLWRVLAVDLVDVSLSGPIPCRGVETRRRAEVATWEHVRSTPADLRRRKSGRKS